MNILTSKTKSLAMASIVAVSGIGAFNADACTSLLVGKKASTDGSTLISYAADSHVLYGALKYQPAADHRPGSVREIYDWDEGMYHGSIPEVAHTYSVVGNMNEHQLSITESTWGGRSELVDNNGIMDYGSLIYVALQRAKTAREAIVVMTDLVKNYGYCSSGESFSIADPNEIWIMELIGKGGKEKGAVWVAIRIPDDCIAGHANQSRIHTFPLNDKENCLYAPDVISFARKMGYFDGKDADFSFSKAYNPADFSGLRGCDARVWSWFNRYKSGMDKYLPYLRGKKDAEVLPLYVKPDKKVSVRDVQNMMRDHFEGTPFDMTKDPGAKILYDVPYRWRPMTFKVDGVEYINERAIATQQTGFVLVSQMRSWLPDAIGGVLWFGNDEPNMVAYTPVYCCANRVPECYAEETANDHTFSWKSAFWVCNWVANMTYPRYAQLFPAVKAVRDELQQQYINEQESIDARAAELLKRNSADCRKFLTDYTVNTAQNMLARWKELGEYLIIKFNDQVVKKEKDGHFELTEDGICVAPERPGFPEQYRRTIVRSTGSKYEYPKE